MKCYERASNRKGLPFTDSSFGTAYRLSAITIATKIAEIKYIVILQFKGREKIKKQNNEYNKINIRSSWRKFYRKYDRNKYLFSNSG